MNKPKRVGCRLLRKPLFAIALMITASTATSAVADEPALPPQTKIRVTIVQWVAAKSEYEQWGALGGEFTVSDTGGVTLPVIGAVAVGNRNSAELATEIATRLKETIGLTEKPATAVEILEYPPIYVVGDVTKPGEYKFHNGLTVLQALAMSGGEFRSATQNDHSKIVGLVGDLKGTENSILRSGAKIARLQAELSGAKEIHFEQSDGPAGSLEAAIHSQERVIFTARLNALDRQSKSLTELRDLIGAEVDNFDEKAKGLDSSIKSTEEQLGLAKSLVERGAATTARQIDLERILTGYRSDRLDLITSTMRARQSIAETTRNLSALYDTRHTEVASELQAEQGAFDQLNSKRDTLQKQLMDALQSNDSSVSHGEETSLSFSIVRRAAGTVNELTASETTGLMPGDVVKVKRPLPIGDDQPLQPASLDPTATNAIQTER